MCEGLRSGPGPWQRLSLLDRPLSQAGEQRHCPKEQRQQLWTHIVLGLHPVSAADLCELGQIKLLNYFGP